jgi:1-deoxy-D-xylulose-5-phosphate reductoisomerase
MYNAANEECVAGFTRGDVGFLAIVDTVERVLDEAPDFPEPGTVDDVLVAEDWARARARELIAAVDAPDHG